MKRTTEQESRFRFEHARPQDGVELEAILEEQSFDGRIGIVYTRRPDAFASFQQEGDPVDVLVCRDAQEGCIAMLGVCAIRSLYVNGIPRQIGYLFGLRARPEYVRATTVLHRGYDLMRKLQAASGRLPFFSVTSILEENFYAQRLLEKKRPFMPSYDFLCPYTVFAFGPAGPRRGRVRTARGVQRRIRIASEADLPRLVSFLAAYGEGHQFFPVLRQEWFGKPPFSSLRPENFLIWEEGGTLLAAGALWDQRAYRQYLVTGYRGLLRLMRPLSFLLSPWGLPPLPRRGAELQYLMLGLLAVRGDEPGLFDDFLDELLVEFRMRGRETDRGADKRACEAPVLVAGVAAGHPLEPVLAARRHISYRSRIYTVAWPEQTEAVSTIRRDLPLHLECGLL